MSIQVRLQKTLRSKKRSFEMNIDFQSDDSFTVLFGPSGTGKSMTLQMIAGLQKPDQGFIAVGDRILFDSSSGINQRPQQRSIGYVFQDFALFPHLSVEKNVAFGLRKKWNPFLHTRDRLRIAKVLVMLEIESVAAARPAELSGGQQQRVALARALVTQPDLLLLDEPFSSLDRPLQEKLRRQLDDIHACFHIPVVMVTHDTCDVRALGKTVVTYHNGRISTIQKKQKLNHKTCETRKLQFYTAHA